MRPDCMLLRTQFTTSYLVSILRGTNTIGDITLSSYIHGTGIWWYLRLDVWEGFGYVEIEQKLLEAVHRMESTSHKLWWELP